MNKNINTFISEILGKFWESVFIGRSLYVWIKAVHAYMLEKLTSITHAAIQSPTQPHTVGTLPEPVSIPVNQCLLNVGIIKDYKLSGLVYQSHQGKSIRVKKSLLGNAEVVQDSLINPKCTWVLGVNMFEVSDDLVLTVQDKYDIPTETIRMDGNLTMAYTLYPYTLSTPVRPLSDFSLLCGYNLDDLPDKMSEAVWRAHATGVTIANVNALLSCAVHNDVCTNDSTVVDTWKDGECWCVLCSDDAVYTGSTLPAVSKGESVQVGDFLFVGVYRYNYSNVPPAEMVPSLYVKSSEGLLVANNLNVDPIKGESGYIPDMHNLEWCSRVSGSSCALLTSDSKVNSLEYVLTKLFPGSGSVYVVDSYAVTDHRLLSVAASVVKEHTLGYTKIVVNSQISTPIVACPYAHSAQVYSHNPTSSLFVTPALGAITIDYI